MATSIDTYSVDVILYFGSDEWWTDYDDSDACVYRATADYRCILVKHAMVNLDTLDKKYYKFVLKLKRISGTLSQLRDTNIDDMLNTNTTVLIRRELNITAGKSRCLVYSVRGYSMRSQMHIRARVRNTIVDGIVRIGDRVVYDIV